MQSFRFKTLTIIVVLHINTYLQPSTFFVQIHINIDLSVSRFVCLLVSMFTILLHISERSMDQLHSFVNICFIFFQATCFSKVAYLFHLQKREIKEVEHER